MKPILVTGAAGRQGGTGAAVVANLLKSGAAVRAMVRSIDNRSEALKRLGAQIVVGDFEDHRSLLAALDGVRSAYFCYPVGAGLTEAAGLFAIAARAVELPMLVDLSLAAANPDSSSPQGRAQFVAEKIFEWSGLRGVHLRVAAFFMENILLMDAPGVRDRSRIANSFGDTLLPWLSGGDVGAIAGHLLLNPDAVTERILTMGGAERLAYREVAERIGDELGRAVRYEELSPEAWHQELVAASSAKGQANVRGADHLVSQSIRFRTNPIPEIPVRVPTLLGRPPVSMAEFVRANRSRLL